MGGLSLSCNVSATFQRGVSAIHIIESARQHHRECRAKALAVAQQISFKSDTF